MKKIFNFILAVFLAVVCIRFFNPAGAGDRLASLMRRSVELPKVFENFEDLEKTKELEESKGLEESNDLEETKDLEDTKNFEEPKNSEAPAPQPVLPVRIEYVSGISFEVPLECLKINKSTSLSDERCFYPGPIDGIYVDYIDLMYVPLDAVNMDKTMDMMMGFYSIESGKAGVSTSEQTFAKVAGEDVMRYTIHHEEGEYTEYVTLIPVKDSGVLHTSYAVKDEYGLIHMEEYEQVLDSLSFPEADVIRKEYEDRYIPDSN